MPEKRWSYPVAAGLALVALLLLAAPPAAAAGPAAPAWTTPEALWSALWQTLHRLWPGPGGPSWAKAGPCIDPNGAPCVAGATAPGPGEEAAAPPAAKAGPCMDPFGAPCASVKGGPCMDPDGASCAPDRGVATPSPRRPRSPAPPRR